MTSEEGPTGMTGTTEMTGMTEMTGPTGPIAPPMISLNDIVNAVEIVQLKEAADKSALESISSLSFDGLRASLIQWATTGYTNAYVIHSVPITPPNVCSDGVSRNLSEYIQFCSGKTINEHVQLLQDRMTDIIVSFANSGNMIIIVVSKLQD